MAPIPSGAQYYRVTGRVIDDLTGAPIPGAAIQLSSVCAAAGSSGRREEDHIVEHAVADKDGGFFFDHVPAMGVNIDATKDGYGPLWVYRRAANDTIGGYVIGPDTGSITVRLAPTASISGIVRNEKGDPLANAWVMLQSYRPWAGWRTLQNGDVIQTAADGSYSFGPLTPGGYYVTTSAWLRKYGPPDRDSEGNAIGYVPQRYPVPAEGDDDPPLSLTEGQHMQIDFQLHRSVLHHVAGSFVGGSEGVNIVDVVDAGGSSAYLMSEPGLSRRFEAWLPAGRFRFEANFTGTDGSFAGSLPFQVADADISGLVMPLGRSSEVEIPIEIRSAATPKRDACPWLSSDAGCGFWYLQTVQLSPDGSFSAGPQSSQTGVFQRGGTYRAESVTVRPGTYLLALQAMGNVYAQSMSNGGVDLLRNPLVVNPGDQPAPVRIVLAEGARVTGTVSRDNKPVHAWVYAIPEQPDARLFQPLLTEPNGKFVLEGLTPASYLFFATDVELQLDIHNMKEISYWLEHALTVALKAGDNPPLSLPLLSAEGSTTSR